MPVPRALSGQPARCCSGATVATAPVAPKQEKLDHEEGEGEDPGEPVEPPSKKVASGVEDEEAPRSKHLFVLSPTHFCFTVSLVQSRNATIHVVPLQAQAPQEQPDMEASKDSDEVPVTWAQMVVM